jgi:hypothetical protein
MMEPFEVIRKDVGRGKHSRVSLVRCADQTLWIWKCPADDSKSHQMAFRKEIDRAKIWRQLELSTVEVKWHKDKRSLFRTYVPGVLALDRIQSREFWTNDTYGAERSALAHLIARAAQQRAYVSDLNPGNLIFDGRRWQVIDSGSIRFGDSPESILKKYRQRLMKNWSSHIHPTEHTFLWDFLQALTLPDQA